MATRRNFIKILSGASMGLFLKVSGMDNLYFGHSDKWGNLLPMKPLGKTGKKVTLLGLGGFHFGRLNDYEAQEMTETTINGGIRFIDSAESYQDGGSEEKIGKFLVPKYRDELFIMTKTRAKDSKEAIKDLEGSLRRLKSDYLDLWQMHSINSENDAESRIENGVLDVFLKAKEEGKVRHIGFTGHVTPKAHLKMLEIADVMETCQMPMNVLDPTYNSFIEEVLPVLIDKKIGVIAMKTLAGGAFFGGGFDGNQRREKNIMDLISVKEAMHFVWSFPIDVLVTGPKDSAMLQEKIDLLNNFVSLTDEQKKELINRVAQFASLKIEYYKA